MRWRASLAGLALLAAGAAGATDLEAALALPDGARETFSDISEPDAYGVPVRRFGSGEAMLEVIEGRVWRRAFRLSGGQTTLGVIRAVEARLAGLGFETVLRCAGADCGGYDFRFGIAVLPPPAMSVSLTDFRQLTMRRAGPGGARSAVSVLASRIGTTVHVQEVVVEEPDALDVPPAPVASAPVPAPPLAAPEALAPPPGDAFGAALDASGHVVLDGVDFVVGSTEIAPGSAAALDAAAAALAARPEVAVIVVGHTDASGDLDLNQRISAARAAAVADALAARGIARARLGSAGVAFLAPRASNATEAGRSANRRVELVAR